MASSGISISLLSPSPNSFRPAKPSMRTPQVPLSQRPIAFFLLIPTSLPHLIPSDPKHQGPSQHLSAIWRTDLPLPLVCMQAVYVLSWAYMSSLSNLEQWFCLSSTVCCLPPPPFQTVTRDESSVSPSYPQICLSIEMGTQPRRCQQGCL